MSQQQPAPEEVTRVVVRPFEDRDQAEVERLFTAGLFAGQIDDNDTAADIDNIRQAYFSDPHDHFWVAEWQGRVVGMIGVTHDQHITAEIRRLRVAKEFQESVLGTRLIQTALEHCRKHGFVKVVLDTRYERSATLDLFTRLGFQHTRTKPHHGRESLEFYLDLYRAKKPDHE